VDDHSRVFLFPSLTINELDEVVIFDHFLAVRTAWVLREAGVVGVARCFLQFERDKDPLYTSMVSIYVLICVKESCDLVRDVVDVDRVGARQCGVDVLPVAVWV